MKSIIVRVAENARDSPFVSRARFTRAGFRARGLDLRRAPTAHRCDLDGAAPGSARAPARSLSRDDQILTFKQWCQLNAISERTGARILAGLNGPPIVHLSAKRIGIRVSDNQWQASRTQGPAV